MFCFSREALVLAVDRGSVWMAAINVSRLVPGVVVRDVDRKLLESCWRPAPRLKW